MARSLEVGADHIYAVHDRWLRGALSEGGSLLTPGAPIWTKARLDELESGFVQRPDLTPDKRYLAKLEGQLSDLSQEAIQLTAELHVVHFLMIWRGAFSQESKRKQIETILSWMSSPPSIPDDIVQAFTPGMANPGQWTLTRRDTQITWIIRFATAWVAASADEQSKLIADPWAMRSFAESIKAESADSARLSLLHLSHPDTFERIVVEGHRTRVLERFGSVATPDDPDPDRHLLAIRKALTPRYGDCFEWYDPRLAPLWQKDAKRWRQFLGWCRRFRSLDSFDDDERTYKLQAVERLRLGRQAWLDQDPDWPQTVAKGFRNSDNNLTLWRVHGEFLTWLLERPAEGSAVLAELWGTDRPASVRLDRFSQALPADLITTRGERINIGSYLLMAEDPHGAPPVKISLFRSCWRSTGWPVDSDDQTLGEVYDRITLFCDEMIRDSQEWPQPLRDRLDAQSAAWALFKAGDQPASFSDSDWVALLAFRATDPVEDPGDGPPAEHGASGGPTKSPPAEWTSEAARRRRRFDVVRDAWAQDEAAQVEYAAREATRQGARVRALELLDALAASGDLGAFSAGLGDGALPRQSRQGAHRTFIAHVLNKGGGDPTIAHAVADAYRAPETASEAEQKITSLHDAVLRVDGIGASFLGLVPLAASVFWSLQDDTAVPLWASAEGTLRSVGWLDAAPDPTPGERYGSFAATIRDLDGAAPLQVLHVLRWWKNGGQVPIDPSAVERCQQNRHLAGSFDRVEHAYADQESQSVAEVNARILINDLKLQGRAIADAVAEVLDEEVSVVVPAYRYSSDLPYRMDAFVGWRLDRPSSPSFRVWVTADRIVAGLHPGSGGADFLAEASDRMADHIPDGFEFFVRSTDASRFDLLPSGKDPQPGMFIVGRELTDAEVASPTLGAVIADIAARLAGLLDLDAAPEDEGGPEAVELTGDFDHLDAAAEDLLIERTELDRITALLEDKGQIILYGPPGTGKTFLAKRLARALAQDDPDRFAIVQFHPATTYEDFIEGLRPVLIDGQVSYQLEPGPLVRLAERAAANPGKTHVLLVDEINRANLPKVFGELLFLLEYRKEPVQPLYRQGESFTLPENLWFIGTMNTADRSVALIDAAMRRRFHFVPFFPDEGVMKGLLGRWLEHHNRPAEVAGFVNAVNAELRPLLGDHLLLGPSFFMKADLSEAALERIWEHNVFPFLEEQLWGREDELARWRWPDVRKRLYLPAQAPVPRPEPDPPLAASDVNDGLESGGS
ncbi:MAG: hypothetical protein JWM47_2487 [Acidimicrobiales bacterium]|nr:hypothetical protein [Acidimicrobiales bacterium]